MKIDLCELGFSYSPKSAVLKDINMVLEEPGLVCIIGPNGVGKSTLVKCINKIHTATEGEVLINGTDNREMSYKELSKVIGFVPASSNDGFAMSVLDTVLMGRAPHKHMGSETEDLHIAYTIIKEMKLTDLALRNYNELSAGQHQRVSIARGLAQEPDLLILDEPTANLDIRHQVMVIELLKRIASEKGIIVLMISHDLNIAAKYADSIIVMSSPGVIYAIGKSEEVITEDMIRHVYGMNSKVISDEGAPHIILGSALTDDELSELYYENDQSTEQSAVKSC